MRQVSLLGGLLKIWKWSSCWTWTVLNLDRHWTQGRVLQSILLVLLECRCALKTLSFPWDVALCCNRALPCGYRCQDDCQIWPTISMSCPKTPETSKDKSKQSMPCPSQIWNYWSDAWTWCWTPHRSGPTVACHCSVSTSWNLDAPCRPDAAPSCRVCPAWPSRVYWKWVSPHSSPPWHCSKTRSKCDPPACMVDYHPTCTW